MRTCHMCGNEITDEEAFYVVNRNTPTGIDPVRIETETSAIVYSTEFAFVTHIGCIDGAKEIVEAIIDK